MHAVQGYAYSAGVYAALLVFACSSGVCMQFSCICSSGVYAALLVFAVVRAVIFIFLRAFEAHFIFIFEFLNSF